MEFKKQMLSSLAYKMNFSVNLNSNMNIPMKAKSSDPSGNYSLIFWNAS